MNQIGIDCNSKKRIVTTCIAILVSLHFSQWSVAQDLGTNTVSSETTASTAGGGTAIFQFLPAQPANGTSYPSHVQIVGNKFILDGGSVRLWFDLFVSDWADFGLIRYASSNFDAVSLTNESDVDLILPTDECNSHDDCEVSLGPGSYCAGVAGSGAPNFCGDNCCRPGSVDQEKSNWVKADCNMTMWDLYSVGTSTEDFWYGLACDPCTPKADCGDLYYLGSLAIDVPVNAIGTYHINLLPVPSTVLIGVHDVAIPFEIIAPSIEISPVQCCDTNFTCVADGITVNQCLNLDPTNFYNYNKTCDDACVCPQDTNGDGACNSFDDCPEDPNKTSPGICGCGVIDSIDIDDDGIPDCIDEFAIPATSTWGMILLILTFTILITVKTIRKTNRTHP